MKGKIIPVLVALIAAFAIAGQAQALICVGQPTEFTLDVQNTGTKDDTYQITSSDTDWVSVQDSVFINAGQTVSLKVTATPKQPDLNVFKLTVVSSEESKVVEGRVKATECRDVTVIASPSELSVCEKSPAVFDIIVKNKGQIEDTYQLTTTMGSIEKTKVVLGPGQTETIKLTIDTTGAAKENEIKVTAASSGVSDSETVKVLVKNCYSAELSIMPKEKSMCLCTSVPYQVLIRNTGELADEYTVTIMGELEQLVSLGAGESKILNFSVPLQYGSGSMEINATAESQHVSLSDTAILTIKPETECYSVQVVGEKTVTVKKCTAEIVPISIKNTGENTQIFRLSVSGPGWMYLTKNDAYVDPGVEKTVYLYISPTYDVAEGSYPVTINVTSVHSQSTLELTVNVISNATTVTPTVPNETGEEEAAEINASGGATGGIISLVAAPLWKMAVVGIITIIIVAILVVRFAVLVKK